MREAPRSNTAAVERRSRDTFDSRPHRFYGGEARAASRMQVLYRIAGSRVGGEYEGTAAGSSKGYATLYRFAGFGVALAVDTNGDGLIDVESRLGGITSGPIELRLVRTGDTVSGFVFTRQRRYLDSRRLRKSARRSERNR